ncbi:alpha/beta fold hydrolase [Methylosinus sp. Sm6]|uniref:alpha/beta fold hydrolase n=1 Tax=Methylosinus sp. Sm6 TaxID=2866948 RepID=UPI001C992EC6|nr:alpha/beta fold hydrolase [Methylosinus sp. Sm6]MBY6241989.1 alpha/beta fold hydrolase [Methylosinus sp. Sm6]
MMEEPRSPRGGTPISFGGCAGFYHAGRSRVAVLICSPWGHEELSMRSSLREFADNLAQAGLPTLRFDYPGTGDSLDPSDRAWRLEDWIAAAHSAAALLLDISRARHLVIVGQGLGVAVAIGVARELEDVAGLALLAGFARGAPYLKQLKVSATMLADAAGLPPADAGDGLALLGFKLPASFIADVKQIDFATLASSPAPSALVVGRPGDRQSATLADHLEKLGAAVTRLDYIDYERLTTNPPIKAMALETFERAASWIEEIRSARDKETNGGAPLAPIGAELPLATERFQETRFRFGPRGLYGAWCEPQGPRRGRVLLFLNCGANPHAGWRRMTVEQARALARRGISSLRIDTSGIGDSPARPDAATKIYSRHQVEEASAAVDWLIERGAREITLVGVCSGAYQAFHTALEDRRVDDLVIVNPAVFVWDDNYEVEEFLKLFSRSNLTYFARLTEADGLRKLLSGRVAVGRLASVVAERVLDKIKGHLAAVVPWFEGPIGRRVHQHFNQLRTRGVHISLVTCENDLSEDELAKHFGGGGTRLRAYANVSWSRIPNADHNLTTDASVEWLTDHLLARATASRGGQTREATEECDAKRPLEGTT